MIWSPIDPIDFWTSGTNSAEFLAPFSLSFLFLTFLTAFEIMLLYLILVCGFVISQFQNFILSVKFTKLTMSRRKDLSTDMRVMVSLSCTPKGQVLACLYEDIVLFLISCWIDEFGHCRKIINCQL
jgi:hypothetical protein